ncbi:MAG: SDR family oxidoreductase [Phycisphaerales bacterium]|nr:SDR family oxidoreductase [Phycisphaerales bacterium]
MKLQDKVALVTGANSGIGKAIATRFAAEGARVVVNYHSHEDDQQAAAEARSFGDESIALVGDVSNREDVQRMMGMIVERFGRLDIAVNNAGIEIKKPFLDTTPQEWERVMAVNVSGVFFVTQAAAIQMVKQGGGGKIINISSVHEDIPFSGYTSYCASKGAVRMMMRNLSIELAPHRINVNNIAPGAIATPINQAVLDDPAARAQAIEEIPWGRFGRPEEVAAVAAFLASDEAEYVTGSTYCVDGGLVRQVTKY